MDTLAGHNRPAVSGKGGGVATSCSSWVGGEVNGKITKLREFRVKLFNIRDGNRVLLLLYNSLVFLAETWVLAKQ